MNKRKEKLKFLPFKILNYLIPKSKKIWLFGSWFGDKYSDSPKYLFEYINSKKTFIKAIWITKNHKVYYDLKEKGYTVYMYNSFLGVYYSMRANICFVTQSYVDINNYLRPPKIFNLWHGNPLKKIGNDVSKSKKKYLKDYYLIASSELEKENLFTAFNVYKENVFITGLPRNEVFKKTNNKLKKIIYMPTHREESKENVISILSEDIDKLNDFLKKHGIILYLKLHYYDLKKFDEFNINFSNIKKYDLDDDIYQTINEFDMLITDYSSIYFDFLLSEKPIIFFPYDFNNYLEKDRELYYNYNEVTPGPKCYNWNEIIKEIETFLGNEFYYRNELLNIKHKFHLYGDGNYSNRVYKEVKKILGINK